MTDQTDREQNARKPEPLIPNRVVLPRFRYAFTVEGNVRAAKIGTTPAGTLVDVDYTNLKATFEPPPNEAKPRKEWTGITATVVSGSDWVLVRSDGVVEFNGRLTMKTVETDDGEDEDEDEDEQIEQRGDRDKRRKKNEEEFVLINAVMTGIVDLLEAYKDDEPKVTRESLWGTWDNDPKERLLPIVLGVRFELAQASEAWAAREYPQEHFEKYARLAQAPYLATGQATLKSGLLCSVSADVLEIVLPP